ncbi:Probable efflux pump membrane transporter TtgB [Sphingobacterium daejeonense]|nr:Probable efflux pump membrane transporter TtgB [Sphingobacterium daejeonense]
MRKRLVKRKISSNTYKDRFFTAFNTSFDRFTDKYIIGVKKLIKNQKVAWAGLAVITAIGAFLMMKSPKSFIPTEDDGFVTYNIAMPAGASLA